MQQHALDAAVFQCAGNHAALVVGANQYGDVARLQRPVFKVQTAFLRIVERGGDFVGAVFGGAFAQDVFVGRFGIGTVQPAHLNGRPCGGEPACFPRSADVGIVDAFQDKRAVFAAEQCADTVDQLGVAAVVGGEGVMVPRVFGGLEVGIDVGAAEAVNRLFGVADEEQRVALRDKDFLENFVLQRVGVLKFVNQGDAPVSGDGLRQRFGVRIVGQSAMYVQQ